ncbi:MAG: arylsulfatase [Planctomycetaceae bacterium]|nr:arylsulfatase [Planctomycetaceae bacterium]
MSIHQNHYLVRILLLSVFWCLINSSLKQAAATDTILKPNIIFIMADDMGYGDIRAYNPNSKIDTPHLNRLIKQGMRFTDAHAPAGLCVQTRYGLLTGQYPFRTTLRERIEPCIEADQLTLPGMLQSAGYYTAMLGKWHLGFVGGKDKEDYSEGLYGGPKDRGFDSFFGIPASLDIPPYYWIQNRKPLLPPTKTIGDNFSEGWTKIQGAFWRKGRIAPGFVHAEVLPTLSRRANFFLDTQAQLPAKTRKPFFLYLPLPAPHTPWLPSQKFTGKSKASMYGDFVMMVDDMVGQIIKRLDQHAMAEDTLIIFTSDNGPVWYPADTERLDHSSTGKLRGMKADCYEGGHRVPFIVRWPNKTPAGTVNEHLICHTDMLATLAGLTGQKIPSGQAPDSINQSQLLFMPKLERPLRNTLITSNNAKYFGIRMGSWKMITGLGSGGFTQPRDIKPRDGEPAGQLFNLKEDLSETNNLWLQHPEIVKQLESVLRKSKELGKTEN